MSDNEDDSQKTEDPTPKKIEESRKKGQVALSREVNHWVMLLAATILVATVIGPVFSRIFVQLRTFLEKAHEMPVASGGFALVMNEAFMNVGIALILPFLILLFAAFIGPFAQVGPLYAPESLKPDLQKLSLVKGFKRLFSARSLVEFGKGILKLCAIGLVGTLLLTPYFNGLEHTVSMPMGDLVVEIRSLVLRMMSGILVVLLVIAVADLVFQRYENFQKMRMSKQELKDEYRQTEGDPHVKSKLKQLRAERARQRMMQAVPEADVVITNPTHYSIALKYDPDNDDAPRVIAKGVDEVALRIREVAKEHDIILYEDRPLARSLYDMVELDDVIPSELFKAVAEVISFVFQKRGKL